MAESDDPRRESRAQRRRGADIGSFFLADKADGEAFTDEDGEIARAAGVGAWTHDRDKPPLAGEAPACHRFSADRKAAHPKSHPASFAGWPRSDGYAGFCPLARAGPSRRRGARANVLPVCGNWSVTCVDSFFA